MLFKEWSKKKSWESWSHGEHVFKKEKVAWEFRVSSRHHRYEGRIYDSRLIKLKAQVEDEYLKESYAWSLATFVWSWICEDMPKDMFSHSGVWGRTLQDFTKQAQSRDVIQLEKVKISRGNIKQISQSKDKPDTMDARCLLTATPMLGLHKRKLRPAYAVGSKESDTSKTYLLSRTLLLLFCL
jgi:hypothetical protein